MSNTYLDAIDRTYGELLQKISRSMSKHGILSPPRRHDVGDRFVHSVSTMPTLVIFMSTMAHDRHGWYKTIADIRMAGIYTDVTPVMNPHDAGAVCEDKSYKIAICTSEEKEILLKNGWAIGNIIVSAPNMDKGAALKALVRAWLATWIK